MTVKILRWNIKKEAYEPMMTLDDKSNMQLFSGFKVNSIRISILERDTVEVCIAKEGRQ